jgi:hypothetical protein
MAIGPSITTGANAIIRFVGGSTFAYATDLSVRVKVNQIPIEVMGRSSVAAYEPGTYQVEGGFTLIKYSQAAKLNGMPNTDQYGNRNPFIKTQDENGNYLSDHINPSMLMTSKTFDIEVLENTAYGQISLFKILDCRISDLNFSLNKKSLMSSQYSFVGILFTDMDQEYKEGTVNDLSTSV